MKQKTWRLIILFALIASVALLSSSLLGKQDENVTSPNPPPQVTLSADPTEGKPPLTVTFTAEATDVDLKLPDWAKGKTFKDTSSIEEEVDGKILSYEWSGAVSGSGESVSETFEKAGTYHATVTVKCDDDESVTASVTVKVLPPLKVSASASPSSGEAPLDVDFEADASGGTGSYTYTWSGAVSGSGDSVSETFEEAGTYTATVTVTSGEQTESDSASVIVTKEKEKEEEAGIIDRIKAAIKAMADAILPVPAIAPTEIAREIYRADIPGHNEDWNDSYNEATGWEERPYPDVELP